MKKKFALEKLIISVALCLALGGSVIAEGTATQTGTSSISPAKPDHARANNPAPIELLHDVVIGTGGGRELHAEITMPKTPPKEPMPVILFYHGGGWSAGTHKSAPMNKLLAEHGYFAASIEYRLAGETARWPAQIEDCKLGVRWIRANAEKYHINPNAIAVMGFSAGGHLATCVGIMDKPELEGSGGYPGVSSKVQAVVCFSGPADICRMGKDSHYKFNLFGGTADEKPELFQQASPINFLKLGLPPFLVINGDKEDTGVKVEYALDFIEALKKAGDPVESIIIKDGKHDFGISLRLDISEAIFKFCDKYLK